MEIVGKHYYTLCCYFVLLIPNQQDKTPKSRRHRRQKHYDNVHCGLQDKAGNLVQVQQEKVYRYDGKAYQVYRERWLS
jgi:hypothetical protein